MREPQGTRASPGVSTTTRPSTYTRWPGDAPVEHRVARFPGNRERIRIFAAQMALEMLRRRLIGHRPAAALRVAQ